MEDRSTWNIERRAYKRIVEECIRKITAGENIICPNINDIAGIRAFLRGETAQSSSSVSSRTPVLTLEDISDGDLSLLRRYQRIQLCPEGLKTGKKAGFYELCLEFIKEKRPVTEKRRVIERLIRKRVQGAQDAHTSSVSRTLQDRIDALPSGIRPDR
jgi:hypothetical protein